VKKCDVESHAIHIEKIAVRFTQTILPDAGSAMVWEIVCQRSSAQVQATLARDGPAPCKPR
jgi:hypothetical protein